MGRKGKGRGEGLFEGGSVPPLAERMKPRTLDEVVGQEHIVGAGKPLRQALKAGQLPSLILYGPPGCGKTSIAKAIARETEADFLQINAVTGGVEDIRASVRKAQQNRLAGKKTIVFIDEIHRFNKAQQDALLPSVESGLITLIGATVENPFFDVISPLLSRCLLFTLKPLNREELREILYRALRDEERGLGRLKVFLEKDAEEHLLNISGGDARRVLNILETVVAGKRGDGEIVVTLRDVEQVGQKAKVRYDRVGDMHYDVISAFIKSVRGSDPDAAIYWLALMLTGGEDPRFIARRLVILAAEDVGLADPMALPVATSAAWAVEFVGMPEAQIPLAEATIYLATAEKSNTSYLALLRAKRDIEQGEIFEVPAHLRDASYRGAEKLGHGEGYLYPHQYQEHYVAQKYLPVEKSYYRPSEQGYERRISAFLAHLKELKEKFHR